MSTTSLRDEIRGILYSTGYFNASTPEKYEEVAKVAEILFEEFHARLKALDEKVEEMKLEYPPKEKNDIAQTYAASGYNQALNDIHQLIQEELK